MSLSNFLIAESKTFIKIKNQIDTKIYDKIVNVVYPQLRVNPFFGTNIKKLKGEFDGYYRYRIGSYRLFYLIDNEKIIVMVADIRHRQNSYD
jgi:mRNA interferase RelE/StbE